MTDLSQIWGQLVGRSPEHDQDLKLCEWVFDAAIKLELAGRIAPDVAEQARAHVAAHVLKEHVYENPKAYRSLRKPDEHGDNVIDALRNKIGGSFEESAGAAEGRRLDAFGELIRTAADVGFAENVVTPAQYEYLMSLAAPEELQNVSERMLERVNDDGPRDLDADDLPLIPANEEATNAVSTELWLHRQGMGSALNDPEPQPAESGADENRASDWSERRMENYMARRDREQGVVHREAPTPQDGPRGPILPDNPGFDDTAPYNGFADR